MTNNTNGYAEKITRLLQNVQRKRHLDKLLAEMALQRIELEKKCLDLQVITRREEDDVQLVENNRIVGFLLNLFNKTDEIIEKERAEAYAAKVKYTTAQSELNQLNYDFDKYTRESYTLENSEALLTEEVEKYSLSTDKTAENDAAILNAQLALLNYKKSSWKKRFQQASQPRKKRQKCWAILIKLTTGTLQICFLVDGLQIWQNIQTLTMLQKKLPICRLPCVNLKANWLMCT